MKLKMVVNNYVLSKVRRQLSMSVISETKIDRYHHEIIFKVANDREVQFIQKLTSYKGEIIE